MCVSARSAHRRAGASSWSVQVLLGSWNPVTFAFHGTASDLRFRHHSGSRLVRDDLDGGAPVDRLTDPEETPAPCMRLGVKALYAAIAAMLVVAAFLWASDQIILQNERTIFTADCHGGT